MHVSPGRCDVDRGIVLGGVPASGVQGDLPELLQEGQGGISDGDANVIVGCPLESGRQVTK